jgi:hypothetical protein
MAYHSTILRQIIDIFPRHKFESLPKIIMWAKSSGRSTAGANLWLCSWASCPAGKAYEISL